MERGRSVRKDGLFSSMWPNRSDTVLRSRSRRAVAGSGIACGKVQRHRAEGGEEPVTHLGGWDHVLPDQYKKVTITSLIRESHCAGKRGL